MIDEKRLSLIETCVSVQVHRELQIERAIEHFEKLIFDHSR